MESRKQVLIVDDEKELAGLWAMSLRNNGYDVNVVMDGTEAIASIKQSRPDVIVTDVVMPEMDGFTLYKELRRDQSTRDIPVIVVTGRSKMADSFAVLGVNDFLVKPFDAKTLMGKLEEVFLKSSTQSAESNPAPILSLDQPAVQINWTAVLMSGLIFLVLGGALFLVFYLVSSAGTKEVPALSGYSQPVK